MDEESPLGRKPLHGAPHIPRTQNHRAHPVSIEVFVDQVVHPIAVDVLVDEVSDAVAVEVLVDSVDLTVLCRWKEG